MHQLFSLSSNLIPVMDFEKQFMATSGTTLDQARFAMAFIGALLAGSLIRLLPGAKGACVCCHQVGVAVGVSRDDVAPTHQAAGSIRVRFE